MSETINPLMQFPCAYCKELLDVDEEFIGTSVECPTCGKLVLATEGSGFETIGRIFFEDEDLDDESRPRLADIKLENGQIIGMCRIEKELGKGGMGAVYRARHTRLEIPVALKVLRLDKQSDDDPEFVERFLREARLAARIHHPNVVSVKDVDQDNRTGLFYIVQEYVEGGSLGAVLKKEGALDIRRIVDVCIGVAEALVEASERKIIHRDVKPDNILLTEKGEAKLADLGLAKELASEGQDATVSSTTMGTPNYMSVEQVKDAGRVDTRTDIYSLGATMFHMLTGSTPYKGKSTYNIINNVINQPT
ncbi:MAG: serine/threonine-protein kinase, partial [Verrucomicrobiota bacterium]